MGKSTISMAIFNSYFDITRWLIYGLSMVYRCVTIPSIHGMVGYPMGRSGSDLGNKKNYEPTMTGDGFYIALIEMVMTWGWIIVGYTTLEVNDKEYFAGCIHGDIWGQRV